MSEATEAGRLKSPPFPAIPLQRAIERADQLYRTERDHLVPMASAAKAWGMSPTSSSPIQTVAALKQYGLVEDEGAGPARKVRLTKDALRVILDKQPQSTERDAAIFRCFLAPKIFAELWSKWGFEMPSDQTIINYLVLERRLAGVAPFSDAGALELLGNYRSSMGFALPSAGADAEPDSEASAQKEEPMRTDTPIPAAPQQRAEPKSQSGMLAPGERIVFVEEGQPGQQIKLLATGDIDEIMLDALQDYLERQKRRLGRTGPN